MSSITIDSNLHTGSLHQLMLTEIQSCKSAVLHWSCSAGHLVVHFLPILANGKPVSPWKLDEHSHTHFYQTPCCLCPFLDGSATYKRSKIGWVQFLAQTQTGDIYSDGKYVAACAEQRCGYFGMII
ncbi:hypothetical protein EST38_g7806 [Candolleomyces aberdarensis]|uniref:Uncharacterized protein n=1 Tax=Candolleomyces aberdarensis TaxID=2316362 RepID=A0A4Q2DE75_9AGAR|nr:hypothetical protein EST38_g7806 [Candolleomyces aberdarensis]